MLSGCKKEAVAGVVLSILVLAAGGWAPARGQSGDRRPNIVFILIDDMGWKDVGFMGNSYFETPHIDRLADEGMVFTSAYANAPNCAPTRASLMTGQYTPRHGIYTVSSSMRGKARNRKLVPIPNTRTLSSGAVTIAETLREAGYVSASMGKWHLGDPPGHGPTGQGFDVNVGGYSAGHPPTYFSPYNNPYLADGPRGEHLTERLTTSALRFIENNQERPFFLYLTHYAVHSPWEAREAAAKRYREKASGEGIDPVYGAMVESVDVSVGRIMRKLQTLELDEDTIVIFTSDNGGHAAVTSMDPLRGSKGTLYEGGVRVPLAVRWPGVVEPGSISDVPVISTDFFPTLMEVAGASKPEGKVVDGESLVPLLEGETQYEERPIFWHFPAYLQAYMEEQGLWRTTPAGAVRQGPWKLIEFFEDGRLELYNLDEDIGEQENLAEERPRKVQDMHRLLEAWRADVEAPVPVTPNPKYEPVAE